METTNETGMSVNEMPEASNNATHTHQKEIDKMTLELLVNKRQYRKYLEKTHSEEYAQKKEQYMRFRKYKPQIELLLHNMLNDFSISGFPTHLGNTEIHEIFEALIQKSTYFFEGKEQEMQQQYDTTPEDFETNVMFDIANEIEDTRDLSESNYFVSNNEYIDLNALEMYSIDANDTMMSSVYVAPFVNRQFQGKSFWGKNIIKRDK
jgi:hypothetical protein